MNAPMKPLGAGLHRLPMEQYLADPCPVPSLSSGMTHTLVTRSPAHAWADHPRLNPAHVSDYGEAADMGSIAHALVLEGKDDLLVEIDADDWRTKAAKEARDKARAEGKFPILRGRAGDVRAMVGTCRDFIASSELAGVFDDGEPELTMIWQEGDVWCRARPDWLTRDHSILLHYKTTQGSAEPDQWIRSQMLNMGYDMAAQFYERGLYAMRDGAQRSAPVSVFLVQETTAPYSCSLIGLSLEMRDFADKKVSRAVRLWDQCMKSGQWPAYPTRICYAEPPAWAQRQWEDREIVSEHDDEVGGQA